MMGLGKRKSGGRMIRFIGRHALEQMEVYRLAREEKQKNFIKVAAMADAA